MKIEQSRSLQNIRRTVLIAKCKFNFIINIYIYKYYLKPLYNANFMGNAINDKLFLTHDIAKIPLWILRKKLNR